MYLRKLFLNFSNSKAVYQQLQDQFPYDKLVLMTNKQNWLPDYNIVYKIDQNLKVKKLEETQESQKIISVQNEMELSYLITQYGDSRNNICLRPHILEYQYKQGLDNGLLIALGTIKLRNAIFICSIDIELLKSKWQGQKLNDSIKQLIHYIQKLAFIQSLGLEYQKYQINDNILELQMQTIQGKKNILAASNTENVIIDRFTKLSNISTVKHIKKGYTFVRKQYTGQL